MPDNSFNNIGSEGEKQNNLLIVDPNPCGSAIVNTEDLSISVELEVFRRSDNIIIFNDEKDTTTVTSSIDPKETTRISFIDGAGEKDKVLTTHYTELNSKFSKENEELGTLGIESIDISFNTSYTPIVKIKFKDVRGQLFESGENSPYSFLFRMPYPIFYLTVKGYYGKPVRYALHLTKFSSSLNSDTGSFMVDCDFIGYTYAFLTDILMGYLKAIPYTEIGKSLKDENFIYFYELRDIINRLELKIIEYKKNDVKLRALTIYSDLLDKLDVITNKVKGSLGYNGTTATILNDTKVKNSISYTSEDDRMDELNYKTYENEVLQLVDKYNNFSKEAKNFLLDRTKFEINSGGIYYPDTKLSDFMSIDDNNNITLKSIYDFQSRTVQPNIVSVGGDALTGSNKYPNFRLEGDFSSSVFIYDSEKNNITTDLFEDFEEVLSKPPFINVKNNLEIRYNIFDLRFLYNHIEKIKNEITVEFEKNQAKVSDNFILNITEFFEKEGLNYNGSIGSLFDILCNHVDLFISCIRKVGINISNDIDSGKRVIMSSDRGNFTDYDDGNGTGPINIKAFPEYVVQEEYGLVEKWMGSNPKFENYEEVIFINDLLNAILKQEKRDKAYEKNLITEKINWVPVNPLETKAFNPNYENPWLIVENSNQYPVFKLLIQRMFLYLGYTNKEFNDNNEIARMAKIEANQLYNAVIEDSVKTTLISGNDNNIKISEKVSFFFKKMEEMYGLFIRRDKKFLDWEWTDIIDPDTYVYLHEHKGYDFLESDLDRANYNFIPISQTTAQLQSERNELLNFGKRKAEKLPFVSNLLMDKTVYADHKPEFETFIKILNRSEYNDSFVYEPFVGGSDNITKNIGESTNFGIPVDISVKNSSLGGVYRTHEFLRYEDKKVGIIPLFYEFYDIGADITHKYTSKKNSQYDTFDSEFNYNPNAIKISDIKTLDKLYVKSTLKEVLIDNIKNNKFLNNNFKFQPTFNVKSTSKKIDRKQLRSGHKNFSLFGSEFYYQQSNIGKAFLFLHTIPFNGLGLTQFNGRGILSNNNPAYFNQRGGFVSTPYSWVLFLGGIIYREREIEDILKFNDEFNKTYIPKINGEVKIDKNAYLSYYSNLTRDIRGPGYKSKNANMSFGEDMPYRNKFEDIIKYLPHSVKNIFKNEFISWLNSNNGWLNIKNRLEIFKDGTTQSERKNLWDNFDGNKALFLNEKIGENYSIVTPDKETNQFILDIRDESEAAKSVVNLLMTEKIILNSTYRIWSGDDDDNIYGKFEVKRKYVDGYLKVFLTELKRLNAVPKINIDDEIKYRIFKSNNNNDIKLSLYKNIKSIYDKWIVGIPQNMESTVVTNLFNRFKFIDRSYTNIADKFKIAPTSFINLWSDNTNISFYSFISRILADNNFDFIPLPTFIDYNSVEDVKDVFTPFRFNEAIDSVGPQFICMYFGEHSNKLNIDKTSKFKRGDGFGVDATCENGKLKIGNNGNVPSDFSDGTNKIPYILVNYADQNQSLFKSFKLDQSEFVETQESLEIIENLSNQNRNNSIGQNLFDVYNNRSYSAEIEMLGCAQIQPFMYFQLNNIPMFDGAYSVINVRHHIKPNHMTTTFKGVRIRSVKTKMIDDETLYAHLITNLNEVNSDGANINEIRGAFNDYKDSIEDTPTSLRGSFINPLNEDEVTFNGQKIKKILITSNFNKPRAKGPHQGIDFRADIGSDVIAVTDLIINRVRKEKDGNLYVEFIVKNSGVKAEDKIYIRFMHLSELTHKSFEGVDYTVFDMDSFRNPPNTNDTSAMANGKTIGKGEIIGKSGNSGGVDKHLHIDVRKGTTIGHTGNYINPQWLFNANNWKLKA